MVGRGGPVTALVKRVVVQKKLDGRKTENLTKKHERKSYPGKRKGGRKKAFIF